MTASRDDERRRMVDAQERAGHVTSAAVAHAMRTVPRHEFIPAAHARDAYVEHALPIEAGQTISQPLIVAAMTEALEPAPTDVVLEVGTGSGYQAAVLALLVRRVVSVERIPTLAASARARLDRLGVSGVEIHVADGTLGWPDDGPYDGIIATAAGPKIPAALVEQLAVGGRLVLPVGPHGHQELVRLRKTSGDGDTAEERLGAVSFVPLIGEEGF